VPPLSVRNVRPARVLLRVPPERRHRRRWFGGLGLVAALACATPAFAGDPPAPDREAAAAALEDGRALEARGEYAAALRAYRRCLEIDPSAPSVPAARARAKELGDRSEGDFVPLARLRAFVARRPHTEEDTLALAEAARAFPDGRVRGEALLAAGVALRHDVVRPDLAETVLREAVRDPFADRTTRALALAEVTAILRARGALSEALSLAKEQPGVAPGIVKELARDLRRQRFVWGSHGLLATFAAVGAVSFGRLVLRERRSGAGAFDRAARRVAPALVVLAVLWIGLGAALLVRLHGAGDPKPFLFVGLAALPLVLAARAWHLASPPGAPYAAVRALISAAAALALGFAALARSDAKYLESFGW